MFAPSFLLLLALGQFAQSQTGELRLGVVDPSGLPLRSRVELVSEGARFREQLDTDAEGRLTVKRLPFGTYHVAVAVEGFAPFGGLVEIRSALPTDYHVTLMLAPLHAEVDVGVASTLLDPHQATSTQRMGPALLQRRTTALPGRSLPELVSTQAGWLLEANGVLHPRGSEYQTQYIVDGLPVTDNRSPAFAPDIDADEVHSLSILTGGYPAEYGRKLGGVIEVVTAGAARRGFHGSVAASAGRFATAGGDATAEYGWPRTSVSASAGLASTDRYLDPPVEENDTNHGRIAHAAAHVEHDLTDADRFGAIVRFGRTRFMVPNERVQQEAGQRQDREGQELAGQFSYQRVLSSRALGDVRGMVRTVSSSLRSNEASTPIAAWQDRGVREAYLKGAVSAHAGAHEWKLGGDLSAGRGREHFTYAITNPGQFDPDTPPAFAFDERRPVREQAVFVQDQLRLRTWTVNAGLRWDHYRLMVDEHAVSPRLAVAWAWPRADLVLRGSYDRAFQTPAIENLLLASSPAVEVLGPAVVRLPVRPSRGDFYEAGASKALFSVLRVDASYFVRTMGDFADDDLLLNTGVSFPLAFRRAVVRGAEVTLDVPHWKAVSGSVSYARSRGVGDLPVTGGLLLGNDAAALLTATGQFPLSQDQRHTARARVGWQATSAVWAALTAAYGSGLPFEFTGSREEAVAQYGERIVDRVDLAAGRVRPSLRLDASLGVALLKGATRGLRLQADVRNLTNRLTVVDFAGLFSGTALAAPRSLAVRLRADF